MFSQKYEAVRSLLCYLFPCILIVFTGSCGSDENQITPPRAIDGVLDLRGWSFEKNGNVPLDGHWEFHWGKLLPPNSPASTEISTDVDLIETPSFWNDHTIRNKAIPSDGYATYRLRLLRDPPSGPMSIYFTNILMSYKCFVNGQQITEIGQVGQTRVTTEPRTFTHTVVLETDDTELDVILWVANFHHNKGGMFETPILGLEPQIRKHREQLIALALFLFGSLMIMSIYHFGLYAIRRRGISTLYFGLFALLVGGKILVSDEHFLTQIFPEMSWELLIKLTMLCTFVAPTFFVLFLRRVFPLECPRVFATIYQWVGAILALVTIFFPARIYMETVIPFQISLLIAGVTATWIIVTAAIRNREGARAILVGWILLFATVINDVFHDNLIIRTGYYVSVGLFAFIFSQSFVLAVRYSELFRRSEKLSKELNKKSEELQKANKQLTQFNIDLEQRVQERTHDLEQAHKRLLQTAHRAGMAEISANIIHSIGNILNTVNCKIQAITDIAKSSRVGKLKSISQVIEDQENLVEYFADDRGEKFPRYLKLTSQTIENDNTSIRQEGEEVIQLVGQINEVIMAQQEYALTETKVELVRLPRVVDDVVHFFQEDVHLISDIHIETRIEPDGKSRLEIKGQRSKITFALTEIIKNGIDSLRASDQDTKTIHIHLGTEIIDDLPTIYLKIRDNGIGISEEALLDIFSFGYSTKKNSRGFALHTCANYVKEMRGTISAKSEGIGKGAMFILRFPDPKNFTRASIIPE